MNWENIILFFEQAVFWFGTVVAAASVIIKATPTQKDDAVLAKIIKVLDLVSIVTAKIQENKETSQKEKNAAGWYGNYRRRRCVTGSAVVFFRI